MTGTPSPAPTRMGHPEGEAELMAKHTEGPRVIRCKGSWLEMGRQYGEELRADIANASHAIEELALAAGHDRVGLKLASMITSRSLKNFRPDGMSWSGSRRDRLSRSKTYC